jgi:hypothetical protein
LSYEYQLCLYYITSTHCIKAFSLSRIYTYFQNHVNFMFSKCATLLGIIHSITVRFYLKMSYVLHFILLTFKLKYTSAVKNIIMPTDINKFENIQQTFTSASVALLQSASLAWCQPPIWDSRPIFLLLSLIIFRQLRIC